MKIGVITYNKQHRKSYDLLCLLKMKNYNNVNVYWQRWKDKKSHNPIFQHRPTNCTIAPVACALKFGYCYKPFSSEIINENDIILIGGSGILKKELCDSKKIINAHPGYLPNVRGLDAYKWAVYEGQPIGVTTHIIDENVDAGILLERQIVPVYISDTFHSVAYRQYEIEIEMLVRAIEIFNKGEYDFNLKPYLNDYPAHKRMPKEIEFDLLKRFDKIKEKQYI